MLPEGGEGGCTEEEEKVKREEGAGSARALQIPQGSAMAFVRPQEGLMLESPHGLGGKFSTRMHASDKRDGNSDLQFKMLASLPCAPRALQGGRRQAPPRFHNTARATPLYSHTFRSATTKPRKGQRPGHSHV